MPAQLIGAHIPTSKGLGSAVRRGHELGCTAIQVFTSSPQQWRAKPVTPEMIEDLEQARAETGIRTIVSHDSYLVNLCAPSEEIAERSFLALKLEIWRCSQLGIPYVVSHMGSCKGRLEAEALAHVADAARRILDDMPEGVMLLMETTAGQGSSLNHCFEHLAILLEACAGHSQLGVCLDTCHVFAAGYEIRTKEAYETTFADFDRLVGLDRLKVIHCNDSRKGLGSRVDRHAHIGEGEIGEEAFRFLVNDQRFERTPILLETDPDDRGHERDLAKLRSLMS